MTTLREAATQALEALEKLVVGSEYEEAVEAERAIYALKAALAEPVQEPGDFDHGIGADRFKVVRGAFWWHVLIGDSPTEHGKFRSRASAEKMAADLLREFRNGAFVQHEAALAEPVQEPVAWLLQSELDDLLKCNHRRLGADSPRIWAPFDISSPSPDMGLVAVYTAPPQRTPLTEEEIKKLLIESAGMTVVFSEVDLRLARAIERAHGIGGQP